MRSTSRVYVTPGMSSVVAEERTAGLPRAADAAVVATNAASRPTMTSLRTHEGTARVASFPMTFTSRAHRRPARNDVAFGAALEDIGRVGVDDIAASATSHRAATSRRRRSTGSAASAATPSRQRRRIPPRGSTDSREPVTEAQLERREWTLSQLTTRTRADPLLRAGRGPRDRRRCSLFFTPRRGTTRTSCYPSPTPKRSSRSSATTPRCSPADTRTCSGRDGSATRSTSIPAASDSYDRHTDPPTSARSRMGARHRAGRRRRGRVPPGAVLERCGVWRRQDEPGRPATLSTSRRPTRGRRVARDELAAARRRRAKPPRRSPAGSPRWPASQRQPLG